VGAAGAGDTEGGGAVTGCDHGATGVPPLRSEPTQSGDHWGTPDLATLWEALVGVLQEFGPIGFRVALGLAVTALLARLIGEAVYEPCVLFDRSLDPLCVSDR
jgi:hypothetical protein